MADCLSHISGAELENIISNHRLRGYAAQSVSGRLNAEFQNICERQFQYQKIQAALYLEELKRISRLFSQAGQAAIVYKGGALIPELFNDLGSRELRDIDLWVPPENFEAAKKIFLSAGYSIRPEPTWEGGGGKLIFTRYFGDLFVDFELHKKNYSFESRSLFSLPVNARGFLSPPLEQHFLMLVIHAGFQHTFSDLKWWIDFEVFLKKYQSQMDWLKLAELCKKHQMTRLMSNVLRLMDETEPWFDYPADLFPARQLKAFNLDFLLYPMRDRVRYYWIKHALKENFFRTVLYDVVWLKSRLLPKRIPA